MAQCFKLLYSVIFFSCLHMIRSAPVKISLDNCGPSVLHHGQVFCCLPKSQRPIVDFKLVQNSSRPLRIRRALQCLDQEELDVYKGRLIRAYELMSALPADDPRSLQNQHTVHCTYSTGCLDNSGFGVDIHAGWLFHPFHRLYLYFLEHIMQVLLGDPTFTLHFWNWDNDGAPGPRNGKNGCLKAGNKIPAMYTEPDSPLFHLNRIWRPSPASVPVDLGYSFGATDLLPDNVVLSRNPQILHDVMVMDSVNARIFFGVPYRAGEDTPKTLTGVAGSLESGPHASVHSWIGGDMAVGPVAATDPLFFAHHGNVERIWYMWTRLGPGRTEPEDPDFLDAEFQFFDGNADLVRVKVRDVLDHRAMGYDYEQTYDASWNYGSETSKADDSSHSELLGSLFSSKSEAVRN